MKCDVEKLLCMLILCGMMISITSAVQAGENGKGKIGTGMGEIAPNFEVYTMDGKKVTLNDYRGKPLFVNFWSWWCPPCIKEAELLMTMAKKYEGRIEFLFVGVNRFYRDKKPLDPKEFAEGFGPGLEEFKQKLMKSKLVRPSKETVANHPEKLPEYEARNKEVVDYYMTSASSLFDFRGYWERQFRAKTNETTGIPVTYLINPDGRIALDIHPNEQHWDKNDDILEDLIAGKDLTKYESRFPIPEKHQRKDQAQPSK
ncbi:MAG: TlpA disulfide reductase family protein [Gemmatimonadota bacterium]|jgi:thiol-disulfide isomerase/thioredoxin|nr:TlpA disulfide reductase family protein [Gemmatimonadota bacterium]